MAAYAGDDSEEAKAKIQELKVSLEDAKADLEETEYEKFISDTEALLDELYLEYETILNERLDDIDALMEEMIDEINSNASTIGSTISESAENVNYKLSEEMDTIWNASDKNAVDINAGQDAIKEVITMFSEDFSSTATTTNDALEAIKLNTADMISKLDGIAEEKASSARDSSVGSSNNIPQNPTKPITPTTKEEPKQSSSGGDDVPKVGDKVKFLDGKYYYDSYGKNPAGSKYHGKEVYITNVNEKGTHPIHISTGKKLGSGDLGWLKKTQISGYATGKRNFLNDETAWTQENREREFIVRPSDGAILTPIAKGDSVLNHIASNNIWNMANSPAEFIRDNLNIGTSVPNNSNSQNNYTQHFENVVFSMPNVQNYDEMLSTMQKDKNFERLIDSMTIGRLAGKSSLAKGKSIR